MINTPSFKEVSYFARKKIFKNANFLYLTPIRKFNHEIDLQGHVVVLIPRFTDFVGKRFFQPRLKNPFIKLSLDEAGSIAWTLADGETTIREISKVSLEKLGEKVQPVNNRMTTFFSQLYMRKLVTFKEILK